MFLTFLVPLILTVAVCEGMTNSVRRAQRK
jgi:hypothetical protein